MLVDHTNERVTSLRILAHNQGSSTWEIHSIPKHPLPPPFSLSLTYSLTHSKPFIFSLPPSLTLSPLYTGYANTHPPPFNKGILSLQQKHTMYIFILPPFPYAHTHTHSTDIICQQMSPVSTEKTDVHVLSKSSAHVHVYTYTRTKLHPFLNICYKLTDTKTKLTRPLNSLAASLRPSVYLSAFSSSPEKKERRWVLMSPPKILGAV